MRPRAGGPLSAARRHVLLWVHSVYPLQVMPDADKGAAAACPLSRLVTVGLGRLWHWDVCLGKANFIVSSPERPRDIVQKLL